MSCVLVKVLAPRKIGPFLIGQDAYVNFIDDTECSGVAACSTNTPSVINENSDMNFECAYVTRMVRGSTLVTGRYDRHAARPDQLRGSHPADPGHGPPGLRIHENPLGRLLEHYILEHYFEALVAIGVFMFIIGVVRKETRGQSDAKRLSTKVEPIEA